MKKFLLVLAVMATALTAHAQMQGLRLNANLGYATQVGGEHNDHIGRIDLGVGYQFNSYIYAGIQAGMDYQLACNGGEVTALPIGVKVELSIPTQHSVYPFLTLGFTQAFAMYKTSGVSDAPAYTVLEVMPGVHKQIDNHWGVRLQAGYMKYNSYNGAYRHEHELAGRIGCTYNF